MLSPNICVLLKKAFLLPVKGFFCINLKMVCFCLSQRVPRLMGICFIIVNLKRVCGKRHRKM